MVRALRRWDRAVEGIGLQRLPHDQPTNVDLDDGHDPERRVAFGPSSAALTPVGGIGGGIGMILWLVTLSHVVGGIVAIPGTFRRYQSRPHAS